MSFVSDMLGISKPSAPPVAPLVTQVPTVEDTWAKAQNDSDALRRRQGAASTILAGKTAESAAAPQTATKALLGS